MFVLIRGGKVFTPLEIGVRDILVASGKIIKIAEKIELPESFQATVIDAKGKQVTPGFIDLHVHIAGGGGEGGHAFKTPEINLSQITLSGVTTVLGVLGIDDITRNVESLLSKALGLQEEGISAYITTGSYQYPPITVTDSIRKDIALIPAVIGVGELAIADHRSSHLTFDKFVRIVSEDRIGGMIGGKAGMVQLHIGDGKEELEYLFRLVKETEIPICQVLPTHINRSSSLVAEAIRYAKIGGNVDITATGTSDHEAFERLIAAQVPIGQITISSDSNGSMPVFGEKGHIVRCSVGEIRLLSEEFQQLVFKKSHSVSDILKCFTLNPARRIKIDNHKGSLEEGKDADILIFDNKWEIDRVYACGKLMVSNGVAVLKGRFE